MKTFHLTIAKIGENLFDGDAVSVIVPGSDGLFQVLAGHEAFISELVPGNILVKDLSGTTHEFYTPVAGIAEVSNNQTTVLL